jgi:hypothetical protein
VTSLVLSYEGIDNSRRVYEFLKEKMVQSAFVMRVGLSSTGAMLVYINKLSKNGLPNFDFETISPAIYKFKKLGGRSNHYEKSLIKLFKCIGHYKSSFVYVESKSEYSFEQLVDVAKGIGSDELESFKAEILLIPAKKRSEFQKQFLTVFNSIVTVKRIRLRADNECLIFNAYAPPMPIIELGKLCSVGQTGRRLSEQSNGRFETYPIHELFRDSSLMSRYAILLLGAPGTTGFGKSVLALCLAIHYSIAMNKAKGAPKEEALVAFTTDLDGGNGIEFKPGMVWVIDEFCPSDGDSCIYASSNIFKQLFNIGSPSTIRARQPGIKLPAGVPRIITANALSLEAWGGKKCEITAPHMRKSIVFQIARPLCKPNWAAEQASTCVGAATMLQVSASEIMTRKALELTDSEMVAPSLFGPPVTVMNRIAGGAIIAAALTAALGEGLATQL